MVSIKSFIRSLFCIPILISNGVVAMNINDFANFAFRPEMHPDMRYEFLAYAERGFKTKAFDNCGGVENVLRIWDCDQNALKMLFGFPVNSEIGQLNSRLNATDDGIRGHLIPRGCLELLFNASFGFRYRFFDDFIIGLYLPVLGMRLNNVSWCDETQNVEDQDLRVKELLTNNLACNVKNLGCLDICGWKRTGIGDLLLLLQWIRDFPQPKPLLKNVQLQGYFGPIFPTGLKEDPDHIFALPFGSDGGVGLLFGGGLDLTLGCYARIGLDVALFHVFGNSRERRIKTAKEQTELLLLQKVCAFKDHGLRQQFSLYYEFYQFYKGFSFRTYYQYTKQGEDFLCLDTQDFSSSVANCAVNLEGWTAHAAILNLKYDFGYDEYREMCVKPQLNLFATLPFNGSRIALFSTIGASIAIDF